MASTQKLGIRLVADRSYNSTTLLEIGPHGIMRLGLVKINGFWPLIQFIEEEFILLRLITKDICLSMNKQGACCETALSLYLHIIYILCIYNI